MAGFGDADVARLLQDEGIVRNRSKIEAAIHNARAALELQDAEGSIHEFMWRFRPDSHPRLERLADAVATTPESTAMSKELKRRGFRFVGPTTMYALMQAMGMVNDHLVGCWVHDEVQRLQDEIHLVSSRDEIRGWGRPGERGAADPLRVVPASARRPHGPGSSTAVLSSVLSSAGVHGPPAGGRPAV